MPQKFAIPAYWGTPDDPVNPKRNNYTLLTSPQPPPAGSIIVLNLDPYQNTDPPNRPDPTGSSFNGWRTLVQNYQTLGYIVLGYVDTDDGIEATGCSGAHPPDPPRNPPPMIPNFKPRTESWLQGYINYWYNVFTNPILDGIFFDDGPAAYRFTGGPTLNAPIAQCVKDFYSRLYQYVQNDPTDPTGTRLRPVRPGRPPVGGNTGPAVFLNASGYEEDPGGEWIMSGPNRACEVALLWETSACQYFTKEPRPPNISTNHWPEPTPSWWTNPNYAPDRIAHVIYACHNTYDMQQVIALSNQGGPNSGIAAQYVFVIDSKDSEGANYDHVPLYWTDEIAAVAVPPSLAPTLRVPRSVATSEFYVRDWTDSLTIYDTGIEPTTHKDFVVTSDVWNRQSNAPDGGGVDPANGQPINEDPIVDPHGMITNYAFARIHRSSCATDTIETVTVHFLRADFGVGTAFQDVSTIPGASTIQVTFPMIPDPTNPDLYKQNPNFVQITPGVPWTLSATATPHICLAVEISSQNDPFKVELLGQAASSGSDSLVRNDNNLAQRNLTAVILPASPRPSPFSQYAIAHNGDLFSRNMVLTYEMLGAVQEILRDTFIEVIDAQGKRMSKPFKSGDVITLEDMQPAENRWIGLTAQVQGGSESQVLPVTFYELVDNRVVNGFAIAVQPSPLSTVILANLNLHALEFRRIAATFDIDDAEDESEDALELFVKGKIPSNKYMHFLRSHIPVMSRVIYELGWSQEAGDPFGIRDTLKHLIAVVESGNPNLAIPTHTQMLEKLDAFLTMLQKAQGDTADILQMVRWQRELYSTLPSLKAVKGAHHLVKESEAFIRSYQIGGIGNDTYSNLIRTLLHIFHQTAEALEEALEQDIAAMERHIGSLTGLQKAHRAYLLKLQRLGRKE